jgi:hypothetical protein
LHAAQPGVRRVVAEGVAASASGGGMRGERTMGIRGDFVMDVGVSIFVSSFCWCASKYFSFLTKMGARLIFYLNFSCFAIYLFIIFFIKQANEHACIYLFFYLLGNITFIIFWKLSTIYE